MCVSWKKKRVRQAAATKRERSSTRTREENEFARCGERSGRRLVGLEKEESGELEKIELLKKSEAAVSCGNEGRKKRKKRARGDR